MKLNVIDKHVIELAVDGSDCIKQLQMFNTDDAALYSYVLYRQKHKYVLVYHVSQTAEHNTLNGRCVIINVINAILRNEQLQTVPKCGIVSYEQAPLDLLIELLDPLINSLVREQKRRWRQFEYNDLLQTCKYALCKLYRAGYYIHRSILRQTFINEIYHMLRKHDIVDASISLYTPLKIDNERLSLIDMLIDTQHELDKEAREDAAERAVIVADERDIIIEMIGERQYEQLIKQWTNHTTTPHSQRLVFSLKKKIAKTGLPEYIRRLKL